MVKAIVNSILSMLKHRLNAGHSNDRTNKRLNTLCLQKEWVDVGSAQISSFIHLTNKYFVCASTGHEKNG